MIIETLTDQLPGSGQDAHTVMTPDAIAIRTGARACIAHRRWMTREMVEEVVLVAQRLLDRWPPDRSASVSLARGENQ